MSGFFDVYVTEEGVGMDDASDSALFRSILSWEADEDGLEDGLEDGEDENDAGISAPLGAPIGGAPVSGNGNGSAGGLAGALGRSSLAGGGGFCLSSEAASVSAAGIVSGQSLRSMQSSEQQQLPNHRAAGVGGAVGKAVGKAVDGTSAACGTSAGAAPAPLAGEDEDDYSMDSFLAQLQSDLQSECSGALAPGAGTGIGPGLGSSSVGSHGNSNSNSNSIGGGFGGDGSMNSRNSVNSTNSMNNLLLAGLQHPIPVDLPASTLPQIKMPLLPSVEQAQAHIAQPQPQPQPQPWQQNQQVQVQQVQVKQERPQVLAAAQSQFGNLNFNFGDSNANALLLGQLQLQILQQQQQQQDQGQQQQQQQQQQQEQQQEQQQQPPRVLPAMPPPPPHTVDLLPAMPPPPPQTEQLPPIPGDRNSKSNPVNVKVTITGEQAAERQANANAAAVIIAARPNVNVVSCSDTDGLTTDADAQSSRAKATARERNREHARNTRQRKKAYLDKLKVTVEELCRERDILVSDRGRAANLLAEMHRTRTDVLLSFFALRSTNERRRELWSSILDESCFSCLLPVTPYRSFPASEVQVARCQRTVLGIDGMMADTASLHVSLNSLLDRSRFPDAKVEFRYTLVAEDAVVAGNQMMARWIMTTQNAAECGANMEVSKRGMLRCKFNSAHKITGLELMFDVMAFMLQLKQAAGTDSFSVVPNTVQTCQRRFDVPMVMAMAERPYTIVQVNRLWEDMTGWKAEDVVGRASCRVLQGQATEKANLEGLMLDLCHKRPTNVVLTNYTKSGRQFRNHLNFYPLCTDSTITHYVALTTYAGWTDGGGPVGDPMGSKATTPFNSQEQCSIMPKCTAGRKARAKPAKATVVVADSAKQVVVAGPTNRQDSSTSNCGGDTVSSLTSSLSSSNSDDGGNSNGNSSTTAPSSQQEQAVESSLLDTTPASSLRKTVTSQSSSSSSAGGSTSTNGSSFDEPKSKLRSKREGRKRKNEAATDVVLVEDEKKRKVAWRQTPGTVLI